MRCNNDIQAAPPLEYGCHNINRVRPTLRRLGLDQLKPGLWQSRKAFGEKALHELSASLQRAGGNTSPVIACPMPSGGDFYIISGERRWRAAQLAGIHELLCLVGDYTPDQARFIAAAENLQRDNLNAIEEAGAYADMQESGLTHEEIAAEVGKSRGHISNYIRFLSLPFRVRDLMVNGKLTPSQARPLCTLENSEDQITLANEAAKGGWNVKRITEEVARLISRAKPLPKRPKEDVDVKRLRTLVSETTGYPCVIRKGDDGAWQIGFSATNDDQFTGLLHRLGVKIDEL